MPGKQQLREVTIACRTCRAFGILINDNDPVGVICATCGGKGSQVLTFEPFSGRKKKDGITRVRRAGQGLSPFGGRRKRTGISYSDFLKGKLP